MIKSEIIKFNEAHAIEQIRAAYKEGETFLAMKLCSTYMGIEDMRAAKNKVDGICADLMLREANAD